MLISAQTVPTGEIRRLLVCVYVTSTRTCNDRLGSCESPLKGSRCQTLVGHAVLVLATFQNHGSQTPVDRRDRDVCLRDAIAREKKQITMCIVCSCDVR